MKTFDLNCHVSWNRHCLTLLLSHCVSFSPAPGSSRWKSHRTQFFPISSLRQHTRQLLIRKVCCLSPPHILLECGGAKEPRCWIKMLFWWISEEICKITKSLVSEYRCAALCEKKFHILVTSSLPAQESHKTHYKNANTLWCQTKVSRHYCRVWASEEHGVLKLLSKLVRRAVARHFLRLRN